MKKLLALTTATIIGLGTCVLPVCAEGSQKFADVPADRWYSDFVSQVSELGYMNGTGANTFSPDKYCTRAEMVQILYAMTGKPETANQTAPFDDLVSDWYKKSVQWAYSHDITKGISDTTFGPETNVTREQIAVFLYAYAFYDKPAQKVTISLGDYADADKISGWAKNAVSWAVYNGIISGRAGADNSKYLAPGEKATRAEVATMLVRYDSVLRNIYESDSGSIYLEDSGDSEGFYHISDQDKAELDAVLNNAAWEVSDYEAFTPAYTVFLDGTEYRINVNSNDVVSYCYLNEQGLGDFGVKKCSDPTISKKLYDMLSLYTVDTEKEAYADWVIRIAPCNDPKLNAPLSLLRELSAHHVKEGESEYSWSILSDYDSYAALASEAVASVENNGYNMVEASFFETQNMLAVLVANESDYLYNPILTDVKKLDDTNCEVRVVVHNHNMYVAEGAGAVYMIPVPKEITDASIKLVNYYKQEERNIDIY